MERERQRQRWRERDRDRDRWRVCVLQREKLNFITQGYRFKHECLSDNLRKMEDNDR